MSKAKSVVAAETRPATEETAAAPAPVVAEAKPFTGKLHPSRFQQADMKRNVYQVAPEVGVPYEAIKGDPAYFSHVASRLRIGDRIEVMPDDGSYFAELIVRAAGRQYARLSELRHIPLEKVNTDAPAGFTVLFNGTHHRHTVIRDRDRQILKDGFDTAEDAHGWLAANIKTLAA